MRFFSLNLYGKTIQKKQLANGSVFVSTTLTRAREIIVSHYCAFGVHSALFWCDSLSGVSHYRTKTIGVHLLANGQTPTYFVSAAT